MRGRRSILAIVMSLMCSPLAGAQEALHVLRPLSGFECMSLNLSETQMFDNSVIVPVFANPSQGAPQVGIASATVLVATPLREVNGYLQVLRLDGGSGWIAAHFLKPWHNPNNPNRRCVPSLMSNGKPGFSFASGSP